MEHPPRTASLAERIRYGAPDYWAELQSWLGNEDQPERTQIANLLEGDERAFYSTAFELYLTSLLRTQGWAFERHPTLPGTTKHPDYLVHTDEADFVLEAAVVLDSDAIRVQATHRDSLRDELDGVTGPFDIIMTIDGAIPGGASPKTIADWLRRQLSELKIPDSERVELKYAGDGFSIDFAVFASDQEDTPVVTVEMMGGPVAQDVTTHESIRDTIDFKASRYGKIGRPYVVALDVQTSFPVTSFSLLRALYGTPQWHFATPSQEPMKFLGETHMRNGMFTAHNGSGTPIRTRISAVAVYRRTHRVEGETSHEMVICHNPFAANPLNPNIFADLPQLLPVDSDDDNVTLRWADSPPPPDWARRSAG